MNNETPNESIAAFQAEVTQTLADVKAQAEREEAAIGEVA
jgi:hypothetical protein